MKTWLTGGLVLLGTVCAWGQQEQKKIRLEGQVLSTSGEPLRRATVRLQTGGAVVFMSGPNAAADGQPQGSYTETTGDDGKFVFEDVAEGRYSLMAERPGYVGQRYGASTPSAPGTMLTVKAGDALASLDIRLIPQAIAGGRVTDREGEPLQGIQVRAMRHEYTGGQKQLRAVSAATTDDQGTFRIASLPPGRYYLVADTQTQMVGAGGMPAIMAIGALGGGPQPGRENAQRDTLVATYYPSSLDVSGAAPLDLGAGAEVLGMNVQMRREKVFSIRGAVANHVTNGPANGAMILAIPRGSDEVAATTRAGQDGAFVFYNLLPGAYTLRGLAGSGLQISTGGGVAGTMMVRLAAGPTGAGAPVRAESNASGQVEVAIADADLENVGILLTGGGQIAGSVRADSGELNDLLLPSLSQAGRVDAPPFPPMQALSVRLLATQGVSINLPSARPDMHGVFTLEGVQAGKYNVSVMGLAQGVYVKSMRFGGLDVTKTPLDLASGGGGTLDIVLAKGSGEISGSIADREGAPVRGVTVSLWAKEPNLAAPNNGVRTVTTDQNGAFRFTGLQPDEYYVAAWEELPDPGLGQHIPFLTRFTSEAAAVKLEAEGKPAVAGKLIDRDRVTAEVAKLP